MGDKLEYAGAKCKEILEFATTSLKTTGTETRNSDLVRRARGDQVLVRLFFLSSSF